ncbi:MAG: hypothetical protein EAZ61_00235 [Oscillatoriales cyanobacterium]|nr:MAG: hypothetical protein EAZ61_00235 [Oscillatoriales cyanobacterium]
MRTRQTQHPGLKGFNVAWALVVTSSRAMKFSEDGWASFHANTALESLKSRDSDPELPVKLYDRLPLTM